MTTMPVYTNMNSSVAVTPTYTNAESSNYKIKDYTFLGTDLQIMHSRLSGNNEEEALAMRSQMADDIMAMYEANGSSISRAEALAMVDNQYKYMSGGASVVDTIKESTKDANSFWNYVPIVNLFIDDTSEEDLYKMMEGQETNTKNAEGKAIGTAAVGAVAGYAVGAAVAIKAGTAIGTAVCPGFGTLVGAGIGAVVGLIAWGIDSLV